MADELTHDDARFRLSDKFVGVLSTRLQFMHASRVPCA